MKVSTNKILSWTTALVFFAVAVVLFISVRQSQRVKDTSRSVAHTEEVLDHIQQLFLAALDNETGARGYVITGKNQFLDPIKISEKNLKKEMDTIRNLVTDNPGQLILADSILIYINRRIDFSNRMVAARRDSSAEMASKLVLTGTGKRYTDKIRFFGAALEQEENKLLKKRKKKNEQTISQLNSILYSVLSAGFILSLIIIDRIRSDIKKQKISGQKFHSLLNAAPDAAIVADKNGIVQMINYQTENIFGYTINELTGKSIEFLIPAALQTSDNQPAHFISLATLEKTGAAIEMNALKKNKNKFPVEITRSPLETKEGRLILFSIRDISQRKLAEENLVFLASIAANIIDPIISFDNNFIITRWNEAAENLMEWKSSEVIGKTTQEIFKTDYLFSSRENILEELKMNGFWRGEVIYHLNSGKAINVLSTVSNLKDTKGNITGYLLLIKDITGRKKAEEKIAYMARLVEGTSEAVYSVTTDFIIRTWNKGAERLYGFTAAEAIGQPTFSIVRSQMAEDMRINIRKQLVEHGFWEGELEHLTKSNSSIFVLASATAIKNAIGKIEGYVSVAKDISERKKLETELKKAHGEMEAFTYSVSHDLRAPLRGIIGFTAILEEDYAAKFDDEARRISNVIKSNAIKMGQLIDDLLAFSRTGKQDLIKADIDMNAVINKIIQDDPVQNIKWNIAQLPIVKADISTMRQVWVNLISNAIKYSSGKKNPQIEIGSYTNAKHIIFFIKDNGVGFNDQYKNKLFKVFQRLHSAQEFEGTGVGLALVEKIVTRHGGNVWAEGKINEGAEFYFSLPS